MLNPNKLPPWLTYKKNLYHLWSSGKDSLRFRLADKYIPRKLASATLSLQNIDVIILVHTYINMLIIVYSCSK